MLDGPHKVETSQEEAVIDEYEERKRGGKRQ